MNVNRTPEFEAAVRLMSALMGLTLANKQRFGDEALTIAQGFAERLGMRMGNRIKARAGITGSGIQAVEQLYHAWLDPTYAPYTVDIEVKGNKLIVARTSPTICLGLAMAKQLQLPLEMVCHTISQPFFKGIAKAINPHAMYSAVQMSEPKCIETIELP
jgi:hypothetical protein